MDAATAEMKERHAAMLGRLAELGMELAEALHARALAAETPEETATLSAGFERISRSVRQSMALEARLAREAACAHLAHTIQQQEGAARPRVRRRAEAQAKLDRLIWTEAEDEHTARFWGEGVRRLLDCAELDEGFDDRPVAEIVDEIARALRAQRLREPARDAPLKGSAVQRWRDARARPHTPVPWFTLNPDGTRTPVPGRGPVDTS